MNQFRRLSLAFALAGSLAFSASAQNRIIGANKVNLDDALGHILTLQMSLPATGGTLTLPGNGGTLTSTQAGLVNGQTLFWNNGLKDWETTSLFTNDGASQLGFSGQLTGSISATNYAASISNPAVNATEALLVNQGGSTLPQPGISYSRSAIIAAGIQYGIIATANGGGGGAGVYGSNDNLSANNVTVFPSPGVMGITFSGGSGVYGMTSGGTGDAVTGTQFFGTGLAGHFFGNVSITGNLNVAGTVSKGGGSFKIDDPIDPENKYLYHSFVESPDMMNIYNGVVVLGQDGAATVTMPKWFEALNRDFRYQLTSIGSFAPVYIASEISGNSFSIAGGKAGQKISWQVTGIRHDAFANANRIPTEVEKAPEDRGGYLHPDAFGKGPSESIMLKNAPKISSTASSMNQK